MSLIISPFNLLHEEIDNKSSPNNNQTKCSARSEIREHTKAEVTGSKASSYPGK
ncbi:hypothetical protein LguiB_033524 [Lonicera macranthoides]